MKKRIISLAIALLLVCSLPVSAFAAEYDLAQGSVTVNATETGQTVTHGTNDAVEDSAPVITQSTETTSNTITITATQNATANVTIQDVNIVISDPAGSTQNHSGDAAVTIDMADGASANVTLDGVNIDTRNTGSVSQNQYGDPVYNSGEAAVQITGNGDVTLELDGDNTLWSGNNRAGVEKNTIAPTNTDSGSGNGNLTITDENGTDGSLESTGGLDGSGIGGGHDRSGSNITITGTAEVTAQGGQRGAGIGGGAYRDGSNINISGSAEVTANGGHGGAGIGGGFGGSGSDITITDNAEVTAQGGADSAGIGGAADSGSNITISGNAEVTANGGDGGAGIGGGSLHTGSNITISGCAEVTAKGGASGAGIGGGRQSTGSSDITVSGDAQVKAQGGEVLTGIGSSTGAGAAIGEGGKWKDNTVVKVTPNTDALDEGWIATYAPGTTDLDSATPDSLTYKGASNVADAQPFAKQEPTCTEDGQRAGFTVNGTQVGGETLPATGHSFTNYVSNNDGSKTAKCDNCDATHTIPAPGSKLVREEAPQTAPLYRVIGQDGKDLACKTEQSSGVLTITVDADFASLTGKLGGIRTLKAQGIDTIVFVTNGATSTFALSDLLAQGSTGDSYTLNHNGDTVSFTLGEVKTDINEILAQP